MIKFPLYPTTHTMYAVYKYDELHCNDYQRVIAFDSAGQPLVINRFTLTLIPAVEFQDSDGNVRRLLYITDPDENDYGNQFA